MADRFSFFPFLVHSVNSLEKLVAYMERTGEQQACPLQYRFLLLCLSQLLLLLLFLSADKCSLLSLQQPWC